MGWRPLAPLASLPDGKPVALDAGDTPLVVVRRGDQVYAADALCPHKFGRLAEGTLNGTKLTCPVHAATFELQDGAAQPGSVWAGRLGTYATRVTGALVEVDVPETA